MVYHMDAKSQTRESKMILEYRDYDMQIVKAKKMYNVLGYYR